MMAVTLLSTSALARSQENTVDQPENPQIQNSGTLQEMIITAPRREMQAQQTGITLDVLDQALIDQFNISSLDDVASHLSNIELFEDYPGAGIPTWVIRGVGLQDYNSNNTPTAAIYVDESYQTSAVMGSRNLFDIQQVEVMRGPQGGLYGRNTSGGAILLNTRRAKLGEESGYVNLGYGRWNSRSLESAIGIDLSDDQALRISATIEKSDADWQRSLSSGDEWGGTDSWDARAWYKAPTIFGWSVDLKIQGGEDNSNIALARSVGLYGASGGFCAEVLNGSRGDNCLSFASLNQALQSLPVQLPSMQSADGSVVLSDPINQQESDYISSGLYLNKDFEAFSVESVTTLDYFNYGVQLDLDGATGEFAHRISASDIDVWSQEVRLLSNNEAAFNWLVGAVYSEEKFKERRSFLFGDNFLVVNQLGLSGGNIFYDQNTSMFALYGSIGASLNDQLTIKAAMRYTDEDKEYRNGDMFVPGNVPFYVLRGLESDYQLDNNFSGSIGLEWELSSSSLFYASLSRGFKSGGFYGGFLTSPDELAPYKEEVIDALEVGLKKDFIEDALRLNAAAFYYDYKDVQSFVSRLNSFTMTPIDILSNPADARHYGLELSLEWFPTDQISVGGSLAYLNADFINGDELVRDISGAEYILSGQRPYAPKQTGSFYVGYNSSLTRNAMLDATLSYQFRGDLTGKKNHPVEQAVFRQDGYGLLSIAIDLDLLDKNWSFSLKGENLFNEKYFARIKGDGLNGYAEIPGQPRMLVFGVNYEW